MFVIFRVMMIHASGEDKDGTENGNDDEQWSVIAGRLRKKGFTTNATRVHNYLHYYLHY